MRKVNPYFSNSLKLITALGFLIGNSFPLSAHEIIPTARGVIEEYPHILKCDTGCHKFKNITLAKKNRTTRPECQQCHVGPKKPPNSPFLLPNKVFPLENSGLTIKPKLKSLLPDTKIYPKQNILAAIGSKKTKPISIDKNLMALIPAGEFIMGSNERWDDEAPEYIESTEKFYIDLYEVTNAEYEKFTSATQHEIPYHWLNEKIPKNKENHPVTYINWMDAKRYCQWKDKRLPTEKEWEKAARGESGNIYPWGNVWVTNKSNHPYKSSVGTEPVGSYPNGRSPYGLYDMSGNVWEWVDSFYLPHPGNTLTRGEYGTDKRVLKGGSWFDCLSYGCGLSAPTFNRSFFTPEVKNSSFGFRCAKSP